MPKRLDIAVPTPMSVSAAAQAFNSELRIHLIRYFAEHPGRQVDAARSLGVERQVVSSNTIALLKVGVLLQDENRTLRVDRSRFNDLVRALQDFGLPTVDTDREAETANGETGSSTS